MCWSDAKKPKVEKIDPQRSRRSKTLNVRRVEIPGRFPKMSSETKLPVFTVLRHDAIIQIIRIPPSWFVITMIHTTNDNINHASADTNFPLRSVPRILIFSDRLLAAKILENTSISKKLFFYQKSEKILFSESDPRPWGRGRGASASMDFNFFAPMVIHVYTIQSS